MFELLTLAPIFKALIALVVGGFCFPSCGVMVLRLNLVPLRYALMHGVILGGAISLALSLPSLFVIILTNLFVVFLVIILQKDNSISSAAAMVFTMGLASLIMHVFSVPAKDSLSLLWGSPFALSSIDLIILIILSLCLIFYIIYFFKDILTIFFDQELAQSLGLNVKFHYNLMVLIIALTIALAMRLLGALLIDALLILPVLIASKFSKGTKQLFICSSLIGIFLSISGFFISISLDIPLSATIALVAALLYLIATFTKKLERK